MNVRGVAAIVAAVIVAAVAAGALLLYRDAPGTDLDQGWTRNDVRNWYDAYQGSRLLPLAWYVALEQPDSDGLFSDPKYIAGFGYFAQPHGLPTGFALDAQNATGLPHTNLVWKTGQGPSERWVGMTCAACHTSEIQYGSKSFRVEGGATLADFQSFIDALNKSMAETLADPAKFARFAARVLGAGASDADRQKLRGALAQWVGWQQQIAQLNATGVRYGAGRLDAVGYIFNKVELIVSPQNARANTPSAPVSYPFLWNTSQQTHIQWNGMAANEPRMFSGTRTFDLGALGRNFGEATGVFGDVSFAAGQHSSIEAPNLVAMEQLLMRLKPPKWPRNVFPVNAALAAQGKQLYAAHCAACHFDLPRDDLATRTRPDGSTLETMSYFQPHKPGETSIDTDPAMACNAALDQQNTGILQGAATGVAGEPALAEVEPGALVLRTEILKAMKAQWPQLAAAGVQSFFGVLPLRRVAPVRLAAIPGAAHAPALSPCQAYAASSNYQALAYKGRPLAGAWATGPFLHNGSVPTLYDLLLPPAQRPKQFWVGSYQFDPKKVGYVTAQGGANRFLFDTSKPGNSNEGHSFGADLTDQQRWALVEYLKVAGEK